MPSSWKKNTWGRQSGRKFVCGSGRARSRGADLPPVKREKVITGMSGRPTTKQLNRVKRRELRRTNHCKGWEGDRTDDAI
jgi:hypothetical protein